MSAVAHPGAPAPRLAAGHEPGELVSLLARRALLGLLVGFALGTSYFVAILPLLLDSGFSVLDTFRSVSLRFTAGVTWSAVCMTLAMRLPARPLFRVFAGVLGLVAASQTWRLFPQLYHAGYFEVTGYDASRTEIYMLWMQLAVGLLFTLYFLLEEEATRARSALHEAQRAHQLAGQRVLESKLNVLRARVDPAFLFDALSASRMRYAESTPAGERLLDMLIDYLRATLPQARERASTLAEEVRLAHAYLEVAGAAQGRKLALDAELDATLAEAFFPPRVLAPFVEDAARRARGEGGRLTIRGRLEGDRARVLLEDDGAPGPDRAAMLDDLDMALKAFFGPDARAAVHRGLQGRALALEYAWAGLDRTREVP